MSEYSGLMAHRQTPCPLPSSPEHARLEEQAIRLRDSMDGHIIHSPLDTKVLRKAIDIGCGTGAGTHELASQFPNARFIGLDLSPVPVVRDRLPNIQYIQGDFIELSDPDLSGSVLEPGAFDFVFSRLLILGNTNWTAYVDRCVSITKPGAWIEMNDIDLVFHCVPTPLHHDQKT
ncbi:S-adenosyl-L-methionine-dependent methyltransferase [Paraphoma chrysanthemicola]|uniref:S-adenosyl-L-methionine-dependent methyltransferase n=1 Tax=Paraphoma chrysanthemicola TaxID=798071 RepID=A0A8K0RB86_9PLEO|nr:S-adenosyl-L-methionine-dependent methyltransferase [Paraphoma chrysanthemicola]